MSNNFIELPSDIVLENAQIRMNTRNFSGAPNQFGNAVPSFCVWIPEELAPHLAEAGWNIKMAKPYHDGEAPRPFLSVDVRFNENYPHLNPVIYKYTTRNRVGISAETLSSLDRDTILSCDMIIRPRLWKDRRGEPQGIKAYLREMHVTIAESPFANKYARYDYPIAAPAEEEDPF